MATVLLALGSNVGDSVDTIGRTIDALRKELRDITVAPVYISRAVGFTDQPDFYNTALRAGTDLSPEKLLKFVKSLEKKLGRIARFRWGPREIDIDIIFYDDLVVESPNLTIPHPRFAERDFVLRPIADIQPNLVDPVSGKTIHELLRVLPKSERAIQTPDDNGS